MKIARPLRIGAILLFGLVAQSLQAQDAIDVYALADKGLVDSAINVGLRVLQRDTTNMPMSEAVGRKLTDAGRFAEAVPMLERVVRIDGKVTFYSAWALSFLGTCYYALGRVRDALRSWQECLAMRSATKNVTARTQRLLLSVGLDPYYKDWVIEERDHVRVHLPPEVSAPVRVKFGDRFEKSCIEVNAFFGAVLPRKVDVFLWPKPEEAVHIGLGELGFSLPELFVVHSAMNQTRGHELTHVVSYWAARPTVTNKFINEGTAVCFNLSNPDSATLAQAKEAVKELGGTISVKRAWQERGYLPARALYPVGGAFIRHLIDVGGKERFMKLLADERYEHAQEVYGADLDGIISSFEATLYAK